MREGKIWDLRMKGHYKFSPDMCRWHNWLGRMDAYVRKGRGLYPKPSRNEIQTYLNLRGKSNGNSRHN